MMADTLRLHQGAPRAERWLAATVVPVAVGWSPWKGWWWWLVVAAAALKTMEGAAADASAPFARYRISSHAPLDAIQGRSQCPGCSKKRKHYCYDCLRPMNAEAEVPKVELPCDVHVIKHPQEHNSKSTGVHAPILSAARLISYEQDVELPAYDPASTVLLFPSPRSTSLRDMGAALQGVKLAIIVDCTVRKESVFVTPLLIDTVNLVVTDHVSRFSSAASQWSQAHGILSDERLSSLPHVHIEAEKTLFWRYQKGKTEDHLATIEAVYFFCRQFHQALHRAAVPGWTEYTGQYDDLLYYYAYQYELVQRVYRERLSTTAGNRKGDQETIEEAEVASLAGVPAARLPAALSLLRRHREVDPCSGDEVRGIRGSQIAIAGRATSTLQAMGACEIRASNGATGTATKGRATQRDGARSARSPGATDVTGGSVLHPAKLQRTAAADEQTC